LRGKNPEVTVCQLRTAASTLVRSWWLIGSALDRLIERTARLVAPQGTVEPGFVSRLGEPAGRIGKAGEMDGRSSDSLAPPCSRPSGPIPRDSRRRDPLLSRLIAPRFPGVLPEGAMGIRIVRLRRGPVVARIPGQRCQRSPGIWSEKPTNPGNPLLHRLVAN